MSDLILPGSTEWDYAFTRKLAVPEGVANQLQREHELPAAVDLFAGCGGFSLGIIQAGFNVVAAVEHDFHAIHTYLFNLGDDQVQCLFDTEDRRDQFDAYINVRRGVDCLPEPFEHARFEPIRPLGGFYYPPAERYIRHHQASSLSYALQADYLDRGRLDGEDEDLDEVHTDLHTRGVKYAYIGDIRALECDAFLAWIGFDVGELDLIVGGPPCQGMSMAGQRNVYDDRNSLVFEFVRFILECRPKSMVMEEVPGILSMRTPRGTMIMEEITTMLEAGSWASAKALQRAWKLGHAAIRSGAGTDVKGGETDPHDEAENQIALL